MAKQAKTKEKAKAAPQSDEQAGYEMQQKALVEQQNAAVMERLNEEMPGKKKKKK